MSQAGHCGTSSLGRSILSNYLADPGGRFSSDTHRRVLGHLSYPDDSYAWTPVALLNRMIPDIGTNITSTEEIQAVLDELVQEGHAQVIEHNGLKVYKMTEQGLSVLSGGIANEPPPGAAVVGPATIGAGAATQLGPTPVDDHPDVPTGVGGVPTDPAPAEQSQSTQTGGSGAASNPA